MTEIEVDLTDLHAMKRSIIDSGYEWDEKSSQAVHRATTGRLIGRDLQPGEQVHHIDENKKNNEPTNLMVLDANVHLLLTAALYGRMIFIGALGDALRKARLDTPDGIRKFLTAAGVPFIWLGDYLEVEVQSTGGHTRTKPTLTKRRTTEHAK